MYTKYLNTQSSNLNEMSKILNLEYYTFILVRGLWWPWVKHYEVILRFFIKITEYQKKKKKSGFFEHKKPVDFIIHCLHINFPQWYSLRLQSSYWHSAVHSSCNRFCRHMSLCIHKMDFFGGWIYESFSFPVPSIISPFLSNHPLWHASDCFFPWTWLETRGCAFQILSVLHCSENYQIKCWQEFSIRYIPHQTSDSQWWTI